MIHFKTSDFDFYLPAKGGDLTLNQFLKISKSKGTWQEAASILSGVPLEAWYKSEDLELFEKIEPYLEFLTDLEDLPNYFVPDFITIKGQLYKAPGGIGINTAGQKWHLEDCLKKAGEEGKQDIEVYAEAIAIYMQPIVTGLPYDSDLVEKLIPDILECRLSEVFPLAGFFLSNYLRYLNGRKRNYLISQSRKRFEQELTGSAGLETLQHFSLLRRLLIKALTKWSTRIMIPSLPRYFMRQQSVNIKMR